MTADRDVWAFVVAISSSEWNRMPMHGVRQQTITRKVLSHRDDSATQHSE